MDIRFLLKDAISPTATIRGITGPMVPRIVSEFTKSGEYIGPVVSPSIFVPGGQCSWYSTLSVPIPA